jgi:hypothetical protein
VHNIRKERTQNLDQYISELDEYYNRNREQLKDVRSRGATNKSQYKQEKYNKGINILANILNSHILLNNLTVFT